MKSEEEKSLLAIIQRINEKASQIRSETGQTDDGSVFVSLCEGRINSDYNDNLLYQNAHVRLEGIVASLDSILRHLPCLKYGQVPKVMNTQILKNKEIQARNFIKSSKEIISENLQELKKTGLISANVGYFKNKSDINAVPTDYSFTSFGIPGQSQAENKAPGHDSDNQTGKRPKSTAGWDDPCPTPIDWGASSVSQVNTNFVSEVQGEQRGQSYQKEPQQKGDNIDNQSRSESLEQYPEKSMGNSTDSSVGEMSDKSSDKSSNQSSNQSPEKGMDESKEEAKVLGGAQDDTLEVTPKDELGEITDAKLESLDDGTTSTLFSDVPESQTDSVKDEKFEQIASISDQKLGGEQTDLESDKPVIEITLRIEEGNNIADTIQSTLKILKKQTLEYGKFNEDYTSEVKIAIEHTTNIENVSVNSQFSNILGNKEYSYVEHKNNVIRIQGRPEAGYDDTIIFKLKFMTIKDKEIFSKIENVEKELFIAPDPKSMWKVLPVTDETYDGYTSPNDDIKSKHLEDINKILLAASCRGRSHATKGLPRDDNFYFDCNNNNGWKVMAVADGAGSAKYSRKGSEIACKRSVQLFLEEAVQQQLSTICYNDKIQEWKNYYTNNLHSDNTDNIQANGFRSDFTLDDIISAIVFKVFKEIKDESCQKNDSKQDTQVTVHDYNTTLLFLAFKKFDFGYFFISFWIGDGALILYDLNKTGKIVLLGNPDTGEFAGQTLFLTTQSEMVPEKIKNKICYAFADDFESILMMTDGVSDAYFQSDNSLKSPESWKTFWNHVLKHGDDQDEQNKGCPEIFDPSQPLDSKASSLRKWLDFWSTGNHDDRTILIVKD